MLRVLVIALALVTSSKPMARRQTQKLTLGVEELSPPEQLDDASRRKALQAKLAAIDAELRGLDDEEDYITEVDNDSGKINQDTEAYAENGDMDEEVGIDYLEGSSPVHELKEVARKYFAGKYLTRVDLEDAKCLDGSPAAYYISIGAETSKFYIFHQGGAVCQSLEECKKRAKSRGRFSLGSSKGWAGKLAIGNLLLGPSAFLFERDSCNNPLLHDWTYVYMPYCDGGAFLGDSVSDEHGHDTLYFHGKLIREETVNRLKTESNFDTLTDLVIAGSSAGGAATVYNVDWYKNQAPATAKVAGLAGSTWYPPGWGVQDETRMLSLYHMMNVKSSFSTTASTNTCDEELGSKCMNPVQMFGFIETPTFILNSRYDSYMGELVEGQDYPASYTDVIEGSSHSVIEGSNTYQCGSSSPASVAPALNCSRSSVQEFGDWVTKSMKKNIIGSSVGHGAFLDSGYRHGVMCTQDQKIGGKNAGQAFAEWYEKGSNAMSNGGFFDDPKDFPCLECCPMSTTFGKISWLLWLGKKLLG